MLQRRHHYLRHACGKPSVASWACVSSITYTMCLKYNPSSITLVPQRLHSGSSVLGCIITTVSTFLHIVSALILYRHCLRKLHRGIIRGCAGAPPALPRTVENNTVGQSATLLKIHFFAQIARNDQNLTMATNLALAPRSYRLLWYVELCKCDIGCS